MKRLRALLAALSKALGIQEGLLKRAQRRTKSYHRKAKIAERQRDKARRVADRLRRQGHIKRAERKDKKALDLDAKAKRLHHKAFFWRGRMRKLAVRVEGIETDLEKVKKEIAEAGVTIKGNKAHGGTRKQRFRAVALAAVVSCSKGHRRNFYDMEAGGFNCKHEIRGGPHHGERSDCSLTLTGFCWSADLPDPNGLNYTAGFTGTLEEEHNGWHEVSTERMIKHGWGFVLYGDRGNTHHVEAYIGPGTRTVGHGSPPVDFGVINQFGDGNFRCYILQDD